MEVCANCGDFTERLNESTGWCLNCSPLPCANCGGERTSIHRFCIRCQRELWLIRNADRLEELMVGGLYYNQAIETIRSENRAVCIICASPIPGRNKSKTLFCTKTRACKKANRKYIRLVQIKGLGKDLALEEVLREVV